MAMVVIKANRTDLWDCADTFVQRVRRESRINGVAVIAYYRLAGERLNGESRGGLLLRSIL